MHTYVRYRAKDTSQKQGAAGYDIGRVDNLQCRSTNIVKHVGKLHEERQTTQKKREKGLAGEQKNTTGPKTLAAGCPHGQYNLMNTLPYPSLMQKEKARREEQSSTINPTKPSDFFYIASH